MAEPQVVIVMGSDSDWPTMTRCAETLDRFGVAYRVRVVSAHRSPGACHELAASAAGQGVKVIIAAAGLSAALAGAIASTTMLPVIGVPMPGGVLDGLDALLSTVQMPPGVPVAGVGLGAAGATNAAVLAVEMLALSDAALADKLAAHKRKLADDVAAKDNALQQRITNNE